MQAIYRLRKNRQFEYIYHKGKSIACRSMVLIYTPNRNEQLKVGFSISKKVGKSVIRSRVKRLMRENFRLLIPEISKNYNYVVIARVTIVDCTYLDIQRDLRYMLRKAGMLISKMD